MASSVGEFVGHHCHDLFAAQCVNETIGQEDPSQRADEPRDPGIDHAPARRPEKDLPDGDLRLLTHQKERRTDLPLRKRFRSQQSNDETRRRERDGNDHRR